MGFLRIAAEICPHGSICTLPLLSCVAHSPSGVTGVSATDAGCAVGETATAGVGAAAVADTGGGADVDADGVTSWSNGTDAFDVSVAAGCALLATAPGSGAGACARGAAAEAVGVGAVFGAGGVELACVDGAGLGASSSSLSLLSLEVISSAPSSLSRLRAAVADFFNRRTRTVARRGRDRVHEIRHGEREPDVVRVDRHHRAGRVRCGLSAEGRSIRREHRLASALPTRSCGHPPTSRQPAALAGPAGATARPISRLHNLSAVQRPARLPTRRHVRRLRAGAVRADLAGRTGAWHRRRRTGSTCRTEDAGVEPAAAARPYERAQLTPPRQPSSAPYAQPSPMRHLARRPHRPQPLPPLGPARAIPSERLARSRSKPAADAGLSDRLGARSLAGGVVQPAAQRWFGAQRRRDQADLRLFLPRHERQSERAHFRARLRQRAGHRGLHARRRTPHHGQGRLARHARGAGVPARRAGRGLRAVHHRAGARLQPYHYDHIHVDLMRRASRAHHLRAGAISGEQVAARAQQRYRLTASAIPPSPARSAAQGSLASAQEGRARQRGRRVRRRLLRPSYNGLLSPHPEELAPFASARLHSQRHSSRHTCRRHANAVQAPVISRDRRQGPTPSGAGSRARDQREEAVKFASVYTKTVAVVGGVALRWRRIRRLATCLGNAPSGCRREVAGADPDAQDAGRTRLEQRQESRSCHTG